MLGQALLKNLLKETGIDWQGYGASWAGQPVPVVRRGSSLHNMIMVQRDDLQAALAHSVGPDPLATLLYTLQGHYWQPDMPVSVMRHMADDYLRLLGEFPEIVFREVRDDVLLEKDRKFMPKIGELKERLDNKLFHKCFTLTKLQKLLEKAE